MSEQSTAKDLFDSASLYEIVDTYAEFGHHRTGTEADSRTTDWVAAVLDRLGADVKLPEYQFERYVAAAVVQSNGTSVPTAPVYYSGYGHWESANVAVVEVDRSVAGQATGLEPLIVGPSANRILAFALDGPDDLPVHCNRMPAVYGIATGPGQPAVIIPRNWADRVREQANVSFDGALETASSRNIMATLGSPDRRRVNITTPLTGWTPCAGERGTGLAVALAMAVDLAADHHVMFIGASGHELDHLGLRHYLSAHNVAGQPVIHLGASVGAVDWADDGTAKLGRKRLALATTSDALRPGIAERAGAGGWTLVDPEEWPGEGGTWREAEASVLSFLGTFEHFHVDTDQPAVATTPEALKTATTSAIETARYFLTGGRL